MLDNPVFAGAPTVSGLATRGSKRRSNGLTIAVAVSLATHLAIGGYLLTTTFHMPPPDAPPPDPTFNVDTIALPRPAPPKPVETTRPPPGKSTVATVTPTAAVLSPTLHVAVSISGPPIAPSFAPAGDGFHPIALPNVSTPPVITDPAWLARPDADQVSRVYPEEAARRGVAGGVTLRCIVTARGQVTDCAVEEEAPARFAFGKAALSLTRYFRMKPRTEDGQPVDGATVRIPITFRLADG